MAATLSSDKVKCKHCNAILVKKNLKEHTKTAHGSDTKVEFLSTSSVDIRGLFAPHRRKLQKLLKRLQKKYIKNNIPILIIL